MKNSIKIKNGKKNYLIKNEEIKYIYSPYIRRHLDVEKLFRTINNKEKIYGIQDIKILKIDENIEKEYLEKLLKITSGWKNIYHNKSILDEKQWCVEINYNRNKISYFGSNEYPDNWSEFEDFLEYIINNKNNKLDNTTNNLYLDRKNLEYRLLELSIYSVLIQYPEKKHTLFHCACLLDEELSEIYVNPKNLLCVQSNEAVINYLVEMFLELKNKNKYIYHQLLEEVIEAITYYCMKKSDQLLKINLELIEPYDVDEVINISHTIINYKDNINLEKYAQMFITKINNLDYFQATEIIKKCLKYCELKNIKNIENVLNKDDGSKVFKLISDVNKLYYFEVNSNNILQSIRENSIDGTIIYTDRLDSLLE